MKITNEIIKKHGLRIEEYNNRIEKLKEEFKLEKETIESDYNRKLNKERLINEYDTFSKSFIANSILIPKNSYEFILFEFCSFQKYKPSLVTFNHIRLWVVDLKKNKQSAKTINRKNFVLLLKKLEKFKK